MLGLEGTWTFVVKSTYSDYGAPNVDVYYKMSDEEKNCCKKATVDRFIWKNNQYPLIPASWQGDNGYGEGFWDASDGTAHAEGDAPAGEGTIFGRLPWVFDFKFVAKCTKGSHKVLSTIEKRYVTSGNLAGQNGSGRWE